MFRYLLTILYFLIVFSPFAQEVEEVEYLDSVENILVPEGAKDEEYLKPRYYDSIPQVSVGGGEQHQLYSEMLPKYNHDPDFEYSESIKDKLSVLQRITRWFWRVIDDFFPDMGSFNQDLFYDILTVAGLGLLLYLLYRFFLTKDSIFTRIKRDKVEEEEELAFVERNLMDIDVSKYIQEAVNKQNFPLAIRYQQLLNIQVLNRKNLIDWEHTKTNLELTADMKDDVLKAEFLACSSVFDRVWFGDFPINSTDYKRFAEQFESFQKRWS